MPYDLTAVISSSNPDSRETLPFEEKIKAKKMGRPTPNFHFDGSRQCRLIKKYSEHKWICGDAERKALFCFPCLIFKKSSRSLWTTTGITNVPNLTNHIRKHEKTSDHVTAVTAFSLLGTTDIETSISEASMINRNLHNEEVRRNRNMLQHHIDMVVYLSTQGISFRGHREDATSSNKGNFVEGVKLLAKYVVQPQRLPLATL